ncbi:MAG: class I SAM-dependent methyltransferase [Clostridia bacterium]|nr:class I SAM-dependent methyltransferase [Clostridia bacterium]
MHHMTDREWDKALRIQTMGREDESGGKYMPYEPTPYAVLNRLAASGFIDAADHVLDYGCGKGRVAFFLAARLGCRVTGIDHSEKLIAMAEENRARAACAGLVRFACAQAERYDPRDENVFFFFNPFSEAVLRIALRRILRAETARPRRARLIFYYPSDAFVGCLAEEPHLREAGVIDCRDLFDGDNPRERMLVFDAVDIGH